MRWSSIFVTFTLKKIIDWNISFQTVSCIHLMNVDVYDCNSHIHNPACFHLTLDLFQTVWSSSGQFLLLGYTLYWHLRWFVLLLIPAGPSFFEFRFITFVRVCYFNHLHFHFDYIIYSSVGVTTLLYHLNWSIVVRLVMGRMDLIEVRWLLGRWWRWWKELPTGCR